MKKFLAMLLVAAMVFSMAACAKAPEAPKAEETTETTEAAETAETPVDGKVYKVAMICDSSISDGGWGMSCYNAMMDAAKKHGWHGTADSIPLPDRLRCSRAVREHFCLIRSICRIRMVSPGSGDFPFW